MNREDIIKLAREAGIDTLNGLRDDGTASVYYEAWPEQIERFAALIASRVTAAAKAEEREACARVCIEQADDWRAQLDRNYVDACSDCAAAIRARSNT